jgi:phospholipid/cholesterol/gamma-HCH transport system ATP-binding protein
MISDPAVPSSDTRTADPAEPPIRVEDLTAGYGQRIVVEDVSFDVRRGEVLVICGGSGSGKSTVLKNMIGLYRPRAGRILIEGEDIGRAEGEARQRLLRKIGVAYQGGALFGSLTILENVRLPLEEFTDLPRAAMNLIALSKLNLVGLADAAAKLPSELSGGMQKRAAIARAIALDPSFVFLDEPSAGLDPVTSAELDALVLDLSSLLETTFVIVSHELPSIFAIADRVVYLDAKAKTVTAIGPPRQLRDESSDEGVRAFFNRRLTPEAGAPEASDADDVASDDTAPHAGSPDQGTDELNGASDASTLNEQQEG